jgi:radical SAM protein with 4Fe4S-binding SPASM domain
MSTSLARRRWAHPVRFLHGRNQTIATNLANGSFVKIRSEAFAAVQGALAADTSSAPERFDENDQQALSGLLSILQQKGFLVEGDAIEGEPGREPESVEYARTPKIAYYAVTDLCNLACSFCYADARRKPARFRGDTARSIRIVDALASLNVVNLILSGGEPMMREDLFEIAHAAKQSGMLVGLTTNGTLIGPGEAARLRNAGVDYVQVSVESPNAAEHDALRGRGTHAKSLDAIGALQAHGYGKDELFVTATTTRRNFEGLQQLHDFADGIGVTAGASFFQPVGRGYRHQASLVCSERQMLDFLVCRMKQKKEALDIACADQPVGYVADALVPRVINCCGMGLKTLGVKDDGTVVPCHLFFSRPEFGIANVLEDGFLEKLSAYANGLPTVDDIQGCKDCNVRYFCGNGCWAHVQSARGAVDGRNPYCGFYKKYFSAVVWNLGADRAMDRIYDELASSEDAPEG